MPRTHWYRHSFELSRWAWILGTAVASMTGCDSGSGQGCPEGTVTCHCYGNHSCNSPLTCASDICVDLSAGATGGSTALGGSASTSPLNPQGGSSEVTTAATGTEPSVGGAANVGGNPNAGGLPAVGGNANAGGVVNAGGNSNAGGLPSVGGGAATGGALNMGGTNSAGGAVSVGGNANAGGLPAVGGNITTGGVTSAVGSSAALGGQAPLGGAANTGGMLATVGGNASGGQAPATGGTASTTCGNGMVDPGEGCDPSTHDNNLGDGCTPLCKVEPSCPPGGGGCTTRCGDGFVLGDETCDDGNTANDDGCSSTCQIEADFDCTVPALGNTVVVPMVVRDFLSGGDFEKSSSFAAGLYFANQGLLNPSLDATGMKPVLASTTGTYNGNTGQASGIANAASFAQWYDDAAPTAGNSYNKTLATELTLYKNVAGTAYANRWGANGEQWIRESTYGSWCGSVGLADKDADGTPIPCTSCIFDEDLSTPQCDPAPDATTCTTSTAPLLRCEVVGSSYEGIFIEGVFDGTPLFFPADSLTPANPSAVAEIPDYYELGWPPDPSGVKRNFSFTTEVRFWFKYDASQTLTLNFVGDDDAWVFVNKRLAVDIGGIHVPVKGDLTVNTDGTAKAVVTTTQDTTSKPVSTDVTLGLEDGKLYEVAVFQAERQTTGSSYMLTFSGFNSAPSVCTHK